MSVKNYEVGDWVRVRSDLEIKDKDGFFIDYDGIYLVDEMKKYFGEPFQIAYKDGEFYRLKGAGGFAYTDEVLEPLYMVNWSELDIIGFLDGEDKR